MFRFSGQPMKTNLKLQDGQIAEQPEVAYHVFHTLFFGSLTLLFDGCVCVLSQCSVNFSCDANFAPSSCRLRFLWTPYVCMFTAFGVCSPELWMTVFKWFKLKSIHPVVLVSGITFNSKLKVNMF